jgi:hypothetical protein
MKKLLLFIALIPVLSYAQKGEFQLIKGSSQYRWSIVAFCIEVKGVRKLPDVILSMSCYECDGGFDERRFYKDVELSYEHNKKYNQHIYFDVPLDGKNHTYKVPLLKYMFDTNLKRT